MSASSSPEARESAFSAEIDDAGGERMGGLGPGTVAMVAVVRENFAFRAQNELAPTSDRITAAPARVIAFRGGRGAASAEPTAVIEIAAITAARKPLRGRAWDS